MFNMIKSDIYRLIKGRLTVISLLGIILLTAVLGIVGGKNDSGQVIQLGFSAAALFLPIFFTNIFMVVWGNEFSYRVINNTLISGTKRVVFYISKVILTLVLTTLFVSLFAISFVCIVRFQTGEWGIGTALQILKLQLPLYFAVSAVGIFFFNWIKTSYVAVAVFISVAFIADNLIDNLAAVFLPDNDLISQLLLFNNLQGAANLSVDAASNQVLVLLSGSVCLVLALIAGCLLLQKRELK